MSLGRKIKQWVTEHGRESAVQMVSEAQSKGVIPQIGLRDLAESTCGPDWASVLGRFRVAPWEFRGSENTADAVDPTTFATISGNQLIDTIRDKYKSPDFIGDQVSTLIPVSNGNLDTQKEPWLSDIPMHSAASMNVETTTTDDDEDVVQPGMPFNHSGFVPNYLLLGRPQKRSRGVAVTFEMIYADRTRQAQASAESVGKRLGRSKEYRILKVLLGVSNPFTFSYGNSAETTSHTYHRSAGTVGTWVNEVDATPLTNWNDLNTVEQLFNEMRDPNTGQPIDVEADTIFVMPGNWHNAKHILHATEIRSGKSGGTDAAPTGVVTLSQQDTKLYNLLTSKHAYKLAQNAITLGSYFSKGDGTDGTTITAANLRLMWFMGNFKKAFYYREVYPLRVQQAPPMNPEEFNKDIVLLVKASEFGVAGVLDPFQVCRVYGHTYADSTTPG